MLTLVVENLRNFQKSKESIVVLRVRVDCYYYICSSGFLRTFNKDVDITVPRFSLYECS